MTTPTTLLFIVIGLFAGSALGAGLFIISSPASARLATDPTLAQPADVTRAGRRYGETKSAVATVQAIDKAKRTLTLKGEQGKTTTVNVPEDVQAFDQIKKGDKIRMTYQESMALAVHRPGEATPQQTTKETTERIQGASPGRMTERTQTISGQIVSVDAKRNMVKIKGADGKTREITVQDPEIRERLKELKAGEVVEISYTEAVAVTLEPASK
jgi:hypothetical protein